MAYTRISVGARHTLKEILSKMGTPTPINYGDYVTVVDLEDGIYYILEPVPSSLCVYPVVYEIKAAGKWGNLVTSLIIDRSD